MSLENKLTYLNGTKDAIKQAIIGKGVSVTEADTFRSYAEKIGEIQSGGSGISIPNGMLNLTESVPDTLNVENEFKGVIFSNMNNVTNMVSSFYSLSTIIQNIIFPSSIPNVVNMENCFRYCGKITSLTLPELPKVENMSYCFYYCSSLTSLTLPDLPLVTNMSSCFYYCSSLTSITFPSSIPNVVNMEDCFNYCSSLTSLTLPDLPKVENMSSCFNNCSSLKSITLPDLPLVTNMSDCFYGCKSLKSITLPDLPKVTNMSGCFNGCSLLISITLPDLPLVTSMIYCFVGCKLLQDLVIGSINPNITTLTNWGISSCTALTVDSLVNIMNALPTITDTRTCTIGTTNLSKLSPEQLAIGVDKGWSIN